MGRKEREREKVSQTDQQAVRQRFSDSRSRDRHKANFTHTQFHREMEEEKMKPLLLRVNV